MEKEKKEMAKETLLIPNLPKEYNVGDNLEIVDNKTKYRVICKIVRVEDPNKNISKEDIRQALFGSILKCDNPEAPTILEEDWEMYQL